MLRSFLLPLCMSIMIPLPNVVGQESQITTWKGTLNARGTELRLEFDVTEDKGKLIGELRSLDQGNTKMKAVDIKVKDVLSFSVPQIGAKYKGKYAKDGSLAEGTFSQGFARLPLTLTLAGVTAAKQVAKPEETLKEAWVGKVKMGLMQPVMQFRIVTTDAGTTAAYFDSITEGRTDFDATWSVDGDLLKFDVPDIKLSYSGILNELRNSAKGTWNQGGNALPLTLKKQATAYDDRNVWENRPQRPVAPFPYKAEEVTFENKVDSVTLAGTLTVPQTPGRHPAVILISGSGPQDRDETIMGHKPFLVLADYLSRRGIAVLRYDDRGTAASSGEFGNATTEDFSRDASAAVEFLRGHAQINPKEIGLVGHSEGGLIAPMVVGLRDDVAFVVLLAATGVDGTTISITQSEAMLRAAGIDEAEIEIAMAVNRAVLEAVAKASGGADLTKDIELAMERVIQTIPESDRELAGKNLLREVPKLNRKLMRKWSRFFHSYDPRPALLNIKCPVLAIFGSKDVQVLPELNMTEIRKALTLGGNEDFETIELDGLNHLFQKCETGAIAEYVSIQETFNLIALARIGDWIINHTSPIK
jgi:pimeloyl-ACP methyl ester carboxylesterase